MNNFNHIREVLTNNGYPESSDSDWFIRIEEYDHPRIIPHFFACGTEDRAKRAVRSLLNSGVTYTVVVFNCPRLGRQGVSFHHRFSALSDREWARYFS